MTLVDGFLSDAFIFSFGLTLLHSLWHGAIVSFVTLIILFFLKNQSSAVRYNISVVSLLVILVLSIWTFVSFNNYFYTNVQADMNSTYAASVSNSISKYSSVWLDLMPEIIRSHLDYFTAHLPLMITVWFIAVIFLSLKYLGAYLYSQRLKNNKVTPVKAYWIDRLAELSQKLNLKKRIQLLESAIVKVPVVIGYFKPAVIVPLGLFTGIPHKQVEAILIHELAHIKRNDYLVKLIQTIVEILFFFNPFVWWISSLINKEREHCCDDLAVNLTKDNISFVKALAGLCELEAGSTSAALAFGKSNNQIIKRMERIMKKNENKNSFSHFTIAFVILLSSLIALGTTTLKSVNFEQGVEILMDTSKVKSVDAKNEIDKKEIEKTFQVLQVKLTKLKAAYENEKDLDIKRKYKQKLKELEEKAKTMETKYGHFKKSEEVLKIEYAKKIEELKKKLSVVKDKETKIKIKQKILQLKKEAEQVPPTPPPPPKVKS